MKAKKKKVFRLVIQTCWQPGIISIWCQAANCHSTARLYQQSTFSILEDLIPGYISQSTFTL